MASLERAKQFLAIAEADNSKREAYKMAAIEVIAYKNETGASDNVIAITLQRERSYITKLRKWHDSGFDGETPFLMDKQATNRAAISHTKRILRGAPMEQVEQILSELPKERQEKIAAATGDPYFQAKHDELDRRKQQTPEEFQQEQEDKAAMKKPFIEFGAGLSAELVIGGHLEAATEELKKLRELEWLTTKALDVIAAYNKEWQREWDFSTDLAGWEES